MINDTFNDSQSDNRSLLIKVFHNRESAESAYNTVLSHGYAKDDISILMSDQTRDKYFTNTDLSELEKTPLEDKALEGLGVGSAIGGVIGGFAAAIAAIGTVLAVPGLGLVIAGPIAAGLAGAGAGSIAGGLAGALVGSGIPADKAQEYEESVKNGAIVLGVKTKSTEDYELLDDKLGN